MDKIWKISVLFILEFENVKWVNILFFKLIYKLNKYYDNFI